MLKGSPVSSGISLVRSMQMWRVLFDCARIITTLKTDLAEQLDQFALRLWELVVAAHDVVIGTKQVVLPRVCDGGEGRR